MSRNGRHRSAPVAALLGSTGGIGFLVLGATMGALVAEWWWPLDLLTSFHLQYAAILAVVALLHVAFRSPGSAALLLAGFLINAAIIAPYVTGESREPPPDAPRLSVLSFNVGVSNSMRREIAQYVAAERPDVLFIIESSFEWEAALTNHGPPMSAVVVVPGGRVSGITAMAAPGVSARLLPVDFAGPGEAVALEVNLDGERIVVLALHPPSPISGERAARRDEIMASAGDWLARVDSPVLLVGDFNATPWSSAFRSLQVRGGLVDTARGVVVQPSWPSGWGPAMIPIDHALHTGGLVLVERHTGPSLGSAHRPLVVTVASTG